MWKKCEFLATRQRKTWGWNTGVTQSGCPFFSELHWPCLVAGLPRDRQLGGNYAALFTETRNSKLSKENYPHILQETKMRQLCNVFPLTDKGLDMILSLEDNSGWISIFYFLITTWRVLSLLAVATHFFESPTVTLSCAIIGSDWTRGS